MVSTFRRGLFAVVSTSRRGLGFDEPRINLLAGQAPATVIAVSAEGVEATVAISGLKAMQVAPQLQTVVQELGGFGNKVGKITVGSCSEFNAANSLLLQYPNLLPNMIRFSKAIRPKGMQVIHRCDVCTKMFGAEIP